jgi:hypothetical protein
MKIPYIHTHRHYYPQSLFPTQNVTGNGAGRF